MTGRFTSRRYPYLPVTLRVRQREIAVDALVDTGFDGEIAVPADMIPNRDRPEAYLPWTLADGAQVFAPAYRGSVQVADFAPFQS